MGDPPTGNTCQYHDTDLPRCELALEAIAATPIGQTKWALPAEDVAERIDNLPSIGEEGVAHDTAEAASAAVHGASHLTPVTQPRSSADPATHMGDPPTHPPK